MAWYEEPPYSAAFENNSTRLLNNNLLIAMFGLSPGPDPGGLATESTQLANEALLTLIKNYLISSSGGPATSAANLLVDIKSNTQNLNRANSATVFYNIQLAGAGVTVLGLLNTWRTDNPTRIIIGTPFVITCDDGDWLFFNAI